MGHAVAKLLHQKHGVTEFCAYVFMADSTAWLRKQTDLKYNQILADHELHELYKKEKVDTEWIKNFEDKYAPPQLWHYLYSDKKLMYSIGPKEETTTIIDPLYPHEDLLKIFQARAKAIEKMLLEEKPDFLLFFAIGSLGHLILYHVAKKLGIKVLNIDFPRVGNRMCVSEDYNTLTGVEKFYQDFEKATEKTEYHEQAEKLIKKFRETGSLDLEYMAVNNDLRNPDNPLLKNPKRIIKIFTYLFKLTKDYRRNKGKFNYGMTNQHPLRFVGHALKRHLRRLKGVKDLYDEPDWNEDYAFFPVHYEPELALLLLSPFHFDQLAIIRQIARALPLHYKLYVKEHPAMIFRRSRKYYEELKKIPNVKLVPHTVSSFELAKNCNLMTLISGTAGWEASILGKPVITFGEVYYNALSFVKRAKALEDLPRLVKDQVENFAYNEKEMQNMVAAVFKDSFPYNFAGLWYENDIEKIMKDEGVQEFCKRIVEKAKS